MGRKVTDSDLAALRATAAKLAAAETGHTPPREELARASRTVCALLAKRHPGREVELRIPPFAAVQLGSGDRGAHTRGTPPNVIETDAVTLVGLASGALTWADAVAARSVRASGVRSELARAFPLPELAASG